MLTTMNREESVLRLCHLAADQVGVDPSGLNAETDLFVDLSFDSLDAVEFIMKIEEEFAVTIPDEQAETVKNISQAADLLVASAR